ncbi:CDP-alcohol phosphatidyltransferase family protein [Alkalihalobacillus trypoxylicola]|uniref:CDP-alcohol phosphatidyltransferase family protein n=1 Tax=Alkalihalobacillus trypoxylicola TaxID=519424 RepID=UPI000A97EE22|nr:CDP-alcohol phosphatidyltransferase family protein [Alkalihalobacillus trypoxylicola]
MLNKFIEWYKSFKLKYVVQERRKHEYFINRYYAHLVDPFFTKLVYDLRFSPNMVTLISASMGIFAGVFFAFEYFIIGAFLVQLHHLFDGADGNLARLTNRCSNFGAMLDKYLDRVVRLVLLSSVLYITDVPIIIKILFVATLFFDLAIVHYFVLPFMKKYELVRAKWKQWCLNHGIIPAFDIFLIYFLLSVFGFLGRLDLFIYVIIIGKNIDWLYRVWECVKTKYYYKVKIKNV